MINADSGVVSVRYMIDDVAAAVAFYTKHFGFTVDLDYAPTFASVSRGNLRLLLSGEKSSGRKAMPDGTISRASEQRYTLASSACKSCALT